MTNLACGKVSNRAQWHSQRERVSCDICWPSRKNRAFLKKREAFLEKKGKKADCKEKQPIFTCRGIKHPKENG